MTEMCGWSPCDKPGILLSEVTDDSGVYCEKHWRVKAVIFYVVSLVNLKIRQDSLKNTDGAQGNPILTDIELIKCNTKIDQFKALFQIIVDYYPLSKPDMKIIKETLELGYDSERYFRIVYSCLDRYCDSNAKDKWADLVGIRVNKLPKEQKETKTFEYLALLS